VSRRRDALGRRLADADTRTLFRAYDRLRREQRRTPGRTLPRVSPLPRDARPWIRRADYSPEWRAVVLISMAAELSRRGYHSETDLYLGGIDQ
jgi:hypothetical protein